MDSSSGDITRLLKRMAGGDKAAEDELGLHVYRELKKIAAYHLRHEKSSHSWQTTELVHEAYLKLVGEQDVAFQGRHHFFGIAAVIMRRLLTDHARKKRAIKRGGNPVMVPLDDDLAISDERCEYYADLDEALKELEKIDPRQGRIVELRYFGGMTEDEIAEFLGISSRTVNRNWKVARAWLRNSLGKGTK